MSSTATHSAEEVLSETAPLLAGPMQHEPDQEHEQRKKARATRVLVLVGITIVAVDFGDNLSYAPLVQILEQIICERQHSAGSIEGGSVSDCKSDTVQSELALLMGWMAFWNQVPGIILALPYGFAADRIGRKPVLLLSVAGLLLQEAAVRFICWRSADIPIEAIWAAPVFQLLGGGPSVGSSMAFTMISDVFPASQKSSIFFRLTGAIVLGEILATPASALAMSWTPWFPFLAGVAFELAALISVFAIRETKPADPKRGTDFPEQQGSYERQALADPENWIQRIKNKWSNLRQRRPQIKVISNVLLVATSYLMASMSRGAVQLVIQYASKKFSWTVAKSSLLVTIKGIINFAILLFLLPQISSLIEKYTSSVRANFLIVKGSAWLLALGTALMAFAQHPGAFTVGITCFALGWGYYAALRSLAMSLVHPSQTGAVNSAIALAQSVGATASGPVLAFAFRRGISLGGIWMGLPYMVASLLFLGAGGLVIGISLP